MAVPLCTIFQSISWAWMIFRQSIRQGCDQDGKIGKGLGEDRAGQRFESGEVKTLDLSGQPMKVVQLSSGRAPATVSVLITVGIPAAIAAIWGGTGPISSAVARQAGAVDEDTTGWC